MEEKKTLVTMHQADLQKVSAKQKVVKVLVQVALYAFLVLMALIVLIVLQEVINSSNLLKKMDYIYF